MGNNMLATQNIAGTCATPKQRTSSMDRVQPVHPAGDPDVDHDIAKKLFGFSEEQIDAWPWGVPVFSSDRQYAAGLVNWIWLSEPHRKSFDRHMAERMPKPHHGGIAETLMVCIPSLICEVALIVAEECGPIALP